MKHPNPETQKQQEKFLKRCPEEKREQREYMFRVGNAIYIYHQLACQDKDDETLKIYYNEWLEGLTENFRKNMEWQGFEFCKTTLQFKRYVNERTDIGLIDWMKEHLSDKDFKEWIKFKERVK